MNIATFNVHYLTHPDSISKVILSNDIHVCGLQEVGGEKTLNELLKFLPNYSGLFDKTYYTFGNGIVYNSDVFKFIKSERFYIGSHSGTKRSLFKVTLSHKTNNKNYIFCVTHLDHVNEQNRLIEWNNLSKYDTKDCIILADMNALTHTDYTLEKLEQITNTRLLSKWEPPKFDLMKIVSKTHSDCGVIVQDADRKSTCRFNTRIDYVLVPHYMKDMVKSYLTIDDFDSTDHSMVWVSISI